MCFYSKLTQDALKIANRFKAEFKDSKHFTPSSFINAFDFPKLPVILNSDSSKIELYNWGLIPYFSVDTQIRKYTLNARIETLNSTKSFQNIVNNRCLVISEGFYEWKHVNNSGKVFKERYLINSKENDLFAFAALYDKWLNKNSGEIFNTFTILTTNANSLMSEIHNSKMRMPVILKREDENEWLRGKSIDTFKFPYTTELQAKKI